MTCVYAALKNVALIRKQPELYLEDTGSNIRKIRDGPKVALSLPVPGWEGSKQEVGLNSHRLH